MPAPSQTFRLHLFDTTRTAQLATLLLLGVFTLLGLSVWAGIQLEPTWLKLVVILGLVGGGGYAGWRAYKQAAVVPAVVTLTATELRVDDTRPAPRLSQTLALADVSTYSYYNTEELRLNRAGAPALRLRSTGALGTRDAGDFGRLVAAFEQAIEQAPNPAGTATRREKTFFEKPISTYLLVVFTLFVVLVLVALVTSKGRVSGGFIGGLVSYGAYITAWRAAAARRNAP